MLVWMTAFPWQQEAVSTPSVSKAISVPPWGTGVLQPYERDKVLTQKGGKHAPTVRSGALETNEIRGAAFCV